MKRTISHLLAIFAFGLASQGADKPVERLSLANDEAGEAFITVYHPEVPNGLAALMCPGGGYSMLATGHEGHDMAEWFTDQGITYVVVNYRLPKDLVPYPMIDANAAVECVRSHAEEWNVNPNGIGIMGASAGGNLASYVATHNGAGSPAHADFQVLFYPVVSMDAAITHDGTRYNIIGENPTEETVRHYSNELQVTDDTPMAFLMHSSDDGLVVTENTIRYFQALASHNVPVEMHIYPAGGHGWGFKDDFEYKSQWTQALGYWLQHVVLPAIQK